MSIKAAMMHNNIFVPGAGDIRKELSAVDNGSVRGTKMELEDQLVYLTLPLRNSTATVRVGIPLSNFAYLLFNKD